MNSTKSHFDSRQVFGKIAAAVALGAVVGSRVRPGGIFLFAGAAAWAALRKPPLSQAVSSSESSIAPPQSSPEPLTEVCPPSEPFIIKDTSDNPPNWEQLREALIPPPNLFTPPQKPTSPLLAAAPQFITTPEPPPPAPPLPSDAKAVIPDSISIPEIPAWLNQPKTHPLRGSQPPLPNFPAQN